MTLIKNGSSGMYKIPQVGTFGCSHYCVTGRDQISRPSSHLLTNSPPISGCTTYEGIFLDLPLYSGKSGEFSQLCINNFTGLLSADLFSQSGENSTDMGIRAPTPVPIMSHTSEFILSKSHHPSGPQFPHLAGN